MKLSQLLITTPVLILTSGILLTHCGGPGKIDKEFKKLSEGYVDAYFRTNPVSATLSGEHRYDSQLDDLSNEGVEKKMNVFKSYLDSLDSINPEQLSEENRIDWNILSDELRLNLFNYEKLNRLAESPLYYSYTLGGGLEYLVYRDYETWDNRIKSLTSRLEQIPLFLAQAQYNLKNPPKVAVEVAIMQTRGLINFIKNDIGVYAAKSPGFYKRAAAAAGEAVKALEEYQQFLKNDLLPDSGDNFRLGKELYSEKFKYVLSPYITPDELLDKAQSELVSIREEMFSVAKQIYEQMYPARKIKTSSEEAKTAMLREMLDRIADDHVRSEELLDVIRDLCDELNDFVIEKELLTLDPDEELQVKWTPEYQRGVAVAGLDSPGALDTNLQSFYYVSPIPDNWTKERKISHLREYNNHMLVTLSAHEGIPGHFVQLYYSARHPSIVRKIFGSGTFSEGWAMYAENLIAETGFRSGDLKAKLSRLKMYLRATINTILDISIHTKGMTKEEAVALMTGQGFQEISEAEGKWIRACLTSCQLCTYFLGFNQIMDLREDYKAKMGDTYSLKEFNEELLSHGTPPVPYLRKTLLR